MKNGVYRTRLQYNSYSVGFYQRDKKEGLFKIFNHQGRLYQEINYVDDKPHGIRKTHHNSRIIMTELFIDGDIKEIKHFFEDGSLFQHYICGDGKKNGPFTEHYEDGTIRTKGNYSDDKQDGEFIYYYRNGVIEKILLYTRDMCHIIEEFYDNGQMARVVTWHTDPQKNGVDNEFHPNGQPKKISRYSYGLLEGDVIEYYDDGQIKKTSKYVNGLLEGIVIEYYENGQIKFIGHYVNGKKHGTFTDYFKNGNVQQISNYSRNQLHGEFKKYRHKDGALIAAYEHERGKRKRQREEEEEDEEEQ